MELENESILNQSLVSHKQAATVNQSFADAVPVLDFKIDEL